MSEREQSARGPEGAAPTQPGADEPVTDPAGSITDPGAPSPTGAGAGGHGPQKFAGLIVWGGALILVGLSIAYLGWTNPTVTIGEGISRSPWYYVGWFVVASGTGTFLAGLYRLLDALHQVLASRTAHEVPDKTQ